MWRRAAAAWLLSLPFIALFIYMDDRGELWVLLLVMAGVLLGGTFLSYGLGSRQR